MCAQPIVNVYGTCTCKNVRQNNWKMCASICIAYSMSVEMPVFMASCRGVHVSDEMAVVGRTCIRLFHAIGQVKGQLIPQDDTGKFIRDQQGSKFCVVSPFLRLHDN